MSQIKPSAGRTYARTGLIRGREHEGRKAILASRTVNSRVAAVGLDGLASGDPEIVWTSDLLDIRPAFGPEPDPDEPVTAILGHGGTLKIPAQIRRHLQLRPGSPVLITMQADAILIQPAEIRPRTNSPAPSLEAFLAGVTAQDLDGRAGPLAPDREASA